jgi:hypothetical protein
MDPKSVWKPLVFLLALGATVGVQRQFEHYPLTTTQTPWGIVDFELAGSAERARQFVDAWRAAGLLDQVQPNIAVIDAWFIPCYTTTLLIGCLWVSGAFRGRLATLGRLLAAAQLLTAALDYGENAAMLRAFDTLRDSASLEVPTDWPLAATLCAWPKFGLIIAACVYIMAGAIVWVWRRLVSKGM